MVGSYGSLITTAKQILNWMGPMRAWSAKRAISNRPRKKFACRPNVTAVTRGRMFIAAGLVVGANVVM